MKILKMQFHGHNILGDLSLDFTDEMGNPVDTVIFAGENGCGKTLILEELYHFAIGPTRAKTIDLEVLLNDAERNTLLTLLIRHSPSSIKAPNFPWKFKFRYDGRAGAIYCVNQGYIGFNPYELFKKVYSTIDVDFSPKDLNQITSNSLDSRDVYYEKSNKELATDISQLLIDIKTQDDADLADWVNSHSGELVPESIKSPRMKRFTNAFDQIFENKKFKGIKTIGGRKLIEFEENGKTVPIENLSSGEKQIVFRAGFLLKNKKSMQGAYVLVDEPEISMHPRWQMKILPFLRSIFTNENGEQTSQIFIATHSPFVIHNPNRCNDKVIILEKDENGTIQVSQSPEFYSWGELKHIAEPLRLEQKFANTCLNVFVEGETDEKYFRKACEIYGIDKSKIQFHWIGSKLKNGNVENSGSAGLDNSFISIKSNRQVIKGKFAFLYDCDVKRKETDADGLYVRVMKLNPNNQCLKRGIENLLNIPTEISMADYYKVERKTTDYGELRVLNHFQKVEFCEDICNLPAAQLRGVFGRIKEEIDRLLELVENKDGRHV